MSFAAESAKSSKSLDLAFVIAGWPVIYTLSRSLTLAQLPTTGDLSSTNGFTAARPWASVPDSIGEGAKGRPEEGATSIGQVDISVLDRYVGGQREISDLLSRQAYLDAALARESLTPDAPASPPGASTSLVAAISPTAQTINIKDAPDVAANLPTGGGIVFVGLECVKYATRVAHGDGTWDLTSCTRGYRLTCRNPHLVDAKVFSFAPTLLRQRAFIYKGFQSLDINEWERGFGGVFAGASRRGAKVVFSVMSTMWLTWNDGREVLVAGAQPADSSGNPTPQLHRTGTLSNDVLSADFNNIVIQVDDATNIGNGHYIANVGGHWMAIKSAS